MLKSTRIFINWGQEVLLFMGKRFEKLFGQFIFQYSWAECRNDWWSYIITETSTRCCCCTVGAKTFLTSAFKFPYNNQCYPLTNLKCWKNEAHIMFFMQNIGPSDLGSFWIRIVIIMSNDTKQEESLNDTQKHSILVVRFHDAVTTTNVMQHRMRQGRTITNDERRRIGQCYCIYLVGLRKTTKTL
jgi:hypothetical protein